LLNGQPLNAGLIHAAVLLQPTPGVAVKHLAGVGSIFEGRVDVVDDAVQARLTTPQQLFGRAALALVVALGAFVLEGLALAANEDAHLPSSPEEALRAEASVALPIGHFYDTPADLESSHPGALLRQEPATDYALPPGMRAVRILYHSKDAGGADVASSAAIVIPAGEAPKGGWPVIAFAHGTSGVARQCAPSAMTNLYYGPLGLLDFARAGFALIVVDYHGLGTVGPHQYIDKIPQANDVIYSVPAARSAVPSLSSQWVVDGHSQGGQAAWGVAEREAVLKDPGYLGAVAVAAATHIDGWLAAHPDSAGKDAGVYMAWLAYAIQARFPQFHAREMLSPVGAAHYDEITTKGCWMFGVALYRGVDTPAMLAPNYAQNPWVQKFFRENHSGAAPIRGPLLAIAGESDTAVPLGAVRDVVDRACRNGQQIVFRQYPGLEHGEAMRQTIGHQIAWMKDRFAGKPAQKSCPR
jgi:secretory lipase